VARELHDEIGPSLASLGLTIDTLMLQPDVGGHTAHQLEQIRRHVTSLVEEVRGAVSDLRHESVSSIVQHTHRLAAELSSDGPGIDVDINERRPPRGQIATEIAAILTEVVRNAVAHADATLIKVGGYVDRDRGSLVVEDDGVGFDTDARPRGHYGLIGIQERASEAGAKLEIESHRGVGTLVRLSWGS
jgi:signal transduction histidine kinase